MFGHGLPLLLGTWTLGAAPALCALAARKRNCDQRKRRTGMRSCLLALGCSALALFVTKFGGYCSQVQLSVQGTNAIVQVYGDPDNDWLLQVTTNFTDWATIKGFGPLISARTNPVARTAATLESRPQFYRALKTAGLYDPTLLRTISLTFTQSNWQTLLANGRTYGTNTVGNLAMDNGATNQGIGARYRGNTSYTGLGGAAPLKKSIAVAIDQTFTNADLMGYNTINLNNAYQDETIMRESVYFTTMRPYTICPAACLAQLYINGANWGVYSQAQQENGDLIRQYCASSDGDRWRAPNMPSGGPSSTGSSALGYLGNTNISTYQPNYELKSDYNTNAWPRLVRAIYVLNNTPTAQFRNEVENVLAVDRWLWFLVLENVFADDDSYWNKGADYMFYYEPESGRIHPVEHDGNEAFFAGDASLSPVQGATDSTRPVIKQLLSNAELRQRYLAHMRTVLQESFNPPNLTRLVNQFMSVSVDAIAADPKKGYTGMSIFTNDLLALKTFITNRYNFLTNHAELKPVPPNIVAVYAPPAQPEPTEVPFVTAQVLPIGTNGLDSVWLYYRAKSYGRFTAAQMLDDGAHGDGGPNDGIFGAATTNYPTGTKVRFYVEARSANTQKAAAFAPARAEQETYSYRVKLVMATSTPVVINEILPSNTSTIADPQGEYDDYIELRNLTDSPVDMTGRYLSDEPNNPRKWQFPDGTIIPADGYLVVWADEDGTATEGLHASFKLSSSGEEVFLTDTDAQLNAVLDSITFGALQTDVAFGRSAADPSTWSQMPPTPGKDNP